MLDKNDFRRGWFKHRLKDVADLEWQAIGSLFVKYLHLVVGHVWLSQIFQMYFQKVGVFEINKFVLLIISHFCTHQYFIHFLIIYGSFFIIQIFSFIAYLCILFNIAIVLMIHLRLQKLFSYLFLFFALTSVCLPDFADLKDYLFEKDAHRKFLFDVTIVWLNARLLSFNLDRLNEQKHADGHRREEDFDFDLIFARNVKRISREECFYILAYLLYLPTFFTGPLNHYSPFVRVSTFFKKFSLIIQNAFDFLRAFSESRRNVTN